jgi:hypothetical protein
MLRYAAICRLRDALAGTLSFQDPERVKDPQSEVENNDGLSRCGTSDPPTLAGFRYESWWF